MIALDNALTGMIKSHWEKLEAIEAQHTAEDEARAARQAAIARAKAEYEDALSHPPEELAELTQQFATVTEKFRSDNANDDWKEALARGVRKDECENLKEEIRYALYSKIAVRARLYSETAVRAFSGYLPEWKVFPGSDPVFLEKFKPYFELQRKMRAADAEGLQRVEAVKFMRLTEYEKLQKSFEAKVSKLKRQEDARISELKARWDRLRAEAE